MQESHFHQLLIGSELHKHSVGLKIIPRNYIATRNLASKITKASQIVHTDGSLQNAIKRGNSIILDIV